MTDPTPRPWKYNDNTAEVYGGDGRPVCHMSLAGRGLIEMNANALLIEGVPQLLEAAQEAERFISFMVNLPRGGSIPGLDEETRGYAEEALRQLHPILFSITGVTSLDGLRARQREERRN